jgi:hypothetical protein
VYPFHFPNEFPFLTHDINQKENKFNDLNAKYILIVMIYDLYYQSINNNATEVRNITKNTSGKLLQTGTQHPHSPVF